MNQHERRFLAFNWAMAEFGLHSGRGSALAMNLNLNHLSHQDHDYRVELGGAFCSSAEGGLKRLRPREWALQMGG